MQFPGLNPEGMGTFSAGLLGLKLLKCQTNTDLALLKKTFIRQRLTLQGKSGVRINLTPCDLLRLGLNYISMWPVKIFHVSHSISWCT